MMPFFTRFVRLVKWALFSFIATFLLLMVWVFDGWRYYPCVENPPAIQVSPQESLCWVFDEKPVHMPSAKQVQQCLDQPIQGVTSKQYPPPSGDARDYVSLSIYWWPNTITKFPYLPRDGLRNPEAERYDAPVLQRMVKTVRILAAAQSTEADTRAVQWLSHWFMDEFTRMSPHLTFAQMMPGLAAGGRQGIIEGVPLCAELLDAIAWLEQRQALPVKLRQALRQWFAQYLSWLMNSSVGKAEAERANNHATWYLVQLAALTQSLGLRDLCAEILDQAPALTSRQFLADGQQPAELRRTKSFAYSVYNLQAWLRIERIAQRRNKSFWRSGPAQAFQYLGRHVESWPHANLDDRPSPNQLEALRHKAKSWGMGSF
jgi:hypothetical protein